MISRDILYRYFEGCASEEELTLIKNWLEASPDNMSLYLKERKLFDAVAMTNSSGDVRRSIRFDYGKIVRECLKVAAVSLIVLTLSYFYFNDRKEVQEEMFQTISVPAGQRINLTLPDGTNVWLNARTTLKYPLSFSKEMRQVELDGEAYFDVVENKAKPFVVQTAKSRLEVLGTVFDVEDYSDKDDFETMLFGGSVRVTPKDSTLQTVTLSPSYKAYLKDGKLEVAYVDDYNVYRWKEGLICFTNESFETILGEFEKYYGLKVVIENEKVKDRHYSGKFRQTDGIDYALRVLQKDIRFDYVRDEDNSKIYIR